VSFHPLGLLLSQICGMELMNYRLEVVQQPKRARMCGFGDKVGCQVVVIMAWV